MPKRADDRIGADDVHAGKIALETIDDEEAVRLLDPDRFAGDAALAKEAGDQLQRVLVFVPGPDLGRDRQRLLDRWTFEEWRDDDRVAMRRDYRRGQAL